MMNAASPDVVLLGNLLVDDIVLREGTPAVSNTKPVTEARAEFDLGLQPRSSAWLKFFDSSKAKAGERNDAS